ncbi:ORF036 [Staphylococcus phage 187]|uniref:ORF036 n=1 Tax=Staphylococcus phage 187 TaxID=2908096 RepID=Q4ZE22_9CAUD|nr:ORF036 [Staphylococcus phage 187]AAX90711.1 ORF036 [Staphylococcus phage 187]
MDNFSNNSICFVAIITNNNRKYCYKYTNMVNDNMAKYTNVFINFMEYVNRDCNNNLEFACDCYCNCYHYDTNRSTNDMECDFKLFTNDMEHSYFGSNNCMEYISKCDYNSFKCYKFVCNYNLECYIQLLHLNFK